MELKGNYDTTTDEFIGFNLQLRGNLKSKGFKGGENPSLVRAEPDRCMASFA